MIHEQDDPRPDAGQERLRPLGDAEDVGEEFRLLADEIADLLPALDRERLMAEMPGPVDAVEQAGDADRLRVTPRLQQVVRALEMRVEVAAAVTHVLGAKL